MDISRLSDLAVAANVSSWWVNVNQFGNESLGVKWRANERWLDMIEVRLPLDYSMMSEDRVQAIPSYILEFISEAAEVFTERMSEHVI